MENEDHFQRTELLLGAPAMRALARTLTFFADVLRESLATVLS